MTVPPINTTASTMLLLAAQKTIAESSKKPVSPFLNSLASDLKKTTAPREISEEEIKASRLLPDSGPIGARGEILDVPPKSSTVSLENIERYNSIVQSFNAYAAKATMLETVAPQLVAQVKLENPQERHLLTFWKDRFDETPLGKACHQVVTFNANTLKDNVYLMRSMNWLRYIIATGNTEATGRGPEERSVPVRDALQKEWLKKEEEKVEACHALLSETVENVYRQTKNGMDPKNIPEEVKFLISKPAGKKSSTIAP